MEYNLATSERASELVARVNHFLDKGWELHGGTSVGSAGTNSLYAQAVCKYTEEDYIQEGPGTEEVSTDEE